MLLTGLEEDQGKRQATEDRDEGVYGQGRSYDFVW
jgi:hypothetical protein